MSQEEREARALASHGRRNPWVGAWYLALLVAVSGCVAAGNQDDSLCPSGALPEIEVIVDTSRAGQFTRDDSHSLSQLTEADGYRPDGLVLGATRDPLQAGLSFRYTSAPGDTGGVCAYVTHVSYRIGYGPRTVSIAREVRSNECLYNEVLAHEMRHIALDDEILAGARDVITSELSGELASGAPSWGSDSAGAVQRLKQRLAALGQHITAAFESARNARHKQEIDTPEESRRTRTMCGGALLRLPH